jgi:hypothetical protein
MEPQPEPASDVVPDATGALDEPATVVEEMEVEEAMLESEAESGGPSRRNVWQDRVQAARVRLGCISCHFLLPSRRCRQLLVSSSS